MFRMLAFTFYSIATCLLVGSTLPAQDQMPQMAKPSKQHQWLNRFEGEWMVDQEARMGPDQPPTAMKGTIRSRMLGGFWVINELKSEMPGMSVTGVQTVGYSAEKKKYVGTWVDSMTDFIWQYEGSVDESGKTLTLEAEGPNMMADGKTTRFQDVYEFQSEDKVLLYSKMLDDDGQWITFMTGTATRKK